VAYSVEWSPRAINDVDEIAAYIARDSAAYASTVVKKILDAADALENFPMMGRMVPEFQDPAIRERIVFSYRLIYRIDQSIVTVLTIAHGKQIL
jgi:toxin ParE1/3/4